MKNIQPLALTVSELLLGRDRLSSSDELLKSRCVQEAVSLYVQLLVQREAYGYIPGAPIAWSPRVLHVAASLSESVVILKRRGGPILPAYVVLRVSEFLAGPGSSPEWIRRELALGPAPGTVNDVAPNGRPQYANLVPDEDISRRGGGSQPRGVSVHCTETLCRFRVHP